MNPLLYGHNPLDRVVAAHQLDDRTIRLYRRLDGKISAEDAEFFPFFFLTDSSLLDDYHEPFWIKELAGNNAFRYLAAFRRWNELWDAVRSILLRYNRTRSPRVSSYHELDILHLRPDPVHQFLLQSGITLFKGMEFEDVVRMQVDLATEPGRRRGRKESAGVLRSIAVTCTSGVSTVLGGKDTDEPTLLREFVDTVQKVDPDVIEGHGIASRFLPLLAERCQAHGIECALGREHLPVRMFGGDRDRPMFDIPGRHLVDTLLLAQEYDSAKKSLEHFTLEYLADHFSLTSGRPSRGASPPADGPPRPHPPGTARRARLTGEVSAHLSMANFYLARMVPYNYGVLVRLGSAARLESLMIREYVRMRQSIPQPSRGTQTTGGYTDLFVTGVLYGVLNADVESLYPSLMMAAGISPSSDELGIFQPLLRELTAARIEAKREMLRAKSGRLRKRLDACQGALKILINSFYGYLGYSRGLFNDFAQADEVTGRGQAVLRDIMKQLELFNARLIEVDTDGLFFVPPDNVLGAANEERFVERISESLPQGLHLALAGRYRKMMSYKRKNYALLDEDNHLIIRGSALISRSIERFLRVFTQRCIECLLTEDIARMHHTFTSCRTQVMRHQWRVEDFARTERTSDDLERYTALVETGERTASASYESARRAGKFLKAGDTVAYYVTGTTADVKVADCSRVAEEWDPNLPDENTAYYLARLDETASKFKVFFEPEAFQKIFSMDDLFGFSPAGIAILTKTVIPDTPGREEREESSGIWLDEVGGGP